MRKCLTGTRSTRGFEMRRVVPVLGVVVLAVAELVWRLEPEWGGQHFDGRRRGGSRFGHYGADGPIDRRSRRGSTGSVIEQFRRRGALGRPRSRSHSRGPESMSSLWTRRPVRSTCSWMASLP